MADKCFFVDLPDAEKAHAQTMFIGARNYDGYLYELGITGKVLSRKWFCVPDAERVEAPKHGDQRKSRIEDANRCLDATPIPIITGSYLKAFGERRSITSLHINGLIGMYAPALLKVYSSEEKPLDRLHAALVRFLDGNPDFLANYAVSDLFKTWSYEDLVNHYKDTPAEHRIQLRGTTLDVANPAHVGIMLMRSFSSGKNVAADASGLTLSASIWVGFIIACLQRRQGNLITRVIEDEVAAHRLDVDTLLAKGWPAIQRHAKPRASATPKKGKAKGVSHHG